MPNYVLYYRLNTAQSTSVCGQSLNTQKIAQLSTTDSTFYLLTLLALRNYILTYLLTYLLLGYS